MGAPPTLGDFLQGGGDPFITPPDPVPGVPQPEPHDQASPGGPPQVLPGQPPAPEPAPEPYVAPTEQQWTEQSDQLRQAQERERKLRERYPRA